MLVRAGILFSGVVLVAVGVTEVAAAEVMFLFEKRFLLVTEVEVECLGVNFGLVGDYIFAFGFSCGGGGDRGG